MARGGNTIRATAENRFRYTGHMRPGKVGRALGIGARLLAQRVQPPPPAPLTPEQQAAASSQRVTRGQQAGQHARTFAKTATRNAGERASTLGKAGRTLWNPFAHAGSILWLEITGLFFLLFAVLFAEHMWMIHGAYRSGPEHQHFLMYAVCCVLFVWFSFTSFARAHRRARGKK